MTHKYLNTFKKRIISLCAGVYLFVKENIEIRLIYCSSNGRLLLAESVDSPSNDASHMISCLLTGYLGGSTKLINPRYDLKINFR